MFCVQFYFKLFYAAENSKKQDQISDYLLMGNPSHPVSELNLPQNIQNLAELQYQNEEGKLP